MTGLFGGLLGLIHLIGKSILFALVYLTIGKKVPDDDYVIRVIELLVGSITICSLAVFIIIFFKIIDGFIGVICSGVGIAILITGILEYVRWLIEDMGKD